MSVFKLFCLGDADQTSFAFFHKQGGKKRKKERRKERKQTVNIAESSTRRRLFARQHIPPQNNKGENAHYTTRETTRVYKNTITNDEIVTTPEENKHRSLFKRAAQREKEEKHFKIERERSLKSARDLDLDVPIDRIEEV